MLHLGNISIVMFKTHTHTHTHTHPHSAATSTLTDADEADVNYIIVETRHLRQGFFTLATNNLWVIIWRMAPDDGPLLTASCFFPQFSLVRSISIFYH